MRRLAVAILLLAIPAAAAEIPPALQSVKRWHMTFEYQEDASNHTATEDWTLAIHASGTATLERTDDPFGEWIGTPSVSVSYSYTGWMQLDSMCRYEESITGSGSPLDVEGSAWLRFFSDGYQIEPAAHDVEVRDEFHYICPDEKITTLTGDRSWIKYAAIKNSFPYPAKDLTLQGTVSVQDYANPEDTMSGVSVPTQVRFNYLLTPEVDELKLKIVDEGDYRNWRPTLAKDGGPGAPLVVKAELVTESGGPPPVKAERFVWSLRETSREPGISMNFPVGAEPGELDMRFEADPGDPSEIFNEAQELERLIVATSDEVRVVPTDPGGWSTLHVRAVLEDGRILEGEVKSSKEPDLRLPRRAADSKIADAWKEAVGARGADGADDDSLPEGDGTKGDGLSLYQEYRGFHEDGVWAPTDPDLKDLFVQAAEPATSGLATFAALSQLVVHAKLLPSELPASRVINANRAQGPGETQQHGLVVKVEGASATSHTDLLGKAFGGPGNPKQISRVQIFSNWHRKTIEKRNQVVAHELFHAVNVYHHGDEDELHASWRLSGEDIVEDSSRGTQTITVWEEADRAIFDVTRQWREKLAGPLGPRLERWIGLPGGQHSGDEACVMRYDVAAAYVGKITSRRILTSEKFNLGFCSSPKGTGVNDENRLPQSRFGDSGRPACGDQILVNDAGDPPGR